MRRADRFVGLARSVAIYHLIPRRQRRLRSLYSQWLEAGDLVFDIGAHVGNRTRAFAALGCRVVAVEPQPHVAALLRTLAGRIPDVTVVEAAVSDRTGRVRLAVSDRTPTVSTTSDAWREARGHEAGFAGVEWNRTVEVEATTLDALIAAYGEPAFVKLDVEGAEAAALQGLSRAGEGPVVRISGRGPGVGRGVRDAAGGAGALPLQLVGGRVEPPRRRDVARSSRADRAPVVGAAGRARRRLRAEARRMSTGTVGTLPVRSVNSARQILVASLMGTAIEFFDFYIYATAAVLVFPRQFFPSSDPATATLASMATFAIAFLARPIGSALFGHFGDRVGRKTTLVAALLTMGISTVAIGALPTYQAIGLAAPLLLAVCRFGQGLGLGGEWGGAILLATENAPPGKRAWYGMFPQLGAPIGFFCSGGIFLLLSRWLTDEQFFAWGWRVPFLSSAVLVIIGLYVRLAITETPVFAQAVARHERVKVPMVTVFKRHAPALVLGTVIGTSVYVIFYLTTVFTLSWGTAQLGYSRNQFLIIQLVGVVFFGLTVPLSALLAERGRRSMLMGVNVVMALFGLVMAPLFESGTAGVVVMMIAGFALVGLRLRAHRHRARRALPDRCPLHRQFAHLQFRRHRRRLARSVRRHLAGHQLGPRLRGLLPVGVGAPLAVRAVRVAGNTRHRRSSDTNTGSPGARYRARPLQTPAAWASPRRHGVPRTR